MNIDEFNKSSRQQGYAVLGKTVDEILSHDDPQLSNHIFDAICLRILDKDSASLTDPERKLREVYLLCGAIGNCGFNFYFTYNCSEDDSAKVALAGLREMGAEGMADVLGRAMSVFPCGKSPEDPTEREVELEQLPPESRSILDECSMRFFDVDIAITDLAIAYAKKRKEDIILP